jgi:hypothetical protein
MDPSEAADLVPFAQRQMIRVRTEVPAEGAGVLSIADVRRNQVKVSHHDIKSGCSLAAGAPMSQNSCLVRFAPRQRTWSGRSGESEKGRYCCKSLTAQD